MSEKDTEYQLTEKGKELAENLANENIKKNALMETIVDKQVNYNGNSESIKADLEKLKAIDKEIKRIEQEKLIETKKVDNKMSYQGAEKIREKSFGALLGEQEGGLGESLKKAISLKMQAKMTGIKEKFDPLNIAKFFGGKTGAAIWGKLRGRSQEDIARYTGSKINNRQTATRLKGEDSDTSVGQGGIANILTKILTLLQNSNESETARQEKLNGLIEETQLEKNKQFEKFLAVLKSLKGGQTVVVSGEENVPSGLPDFVNPFNINREKPNKGNKPNKGGPGSSKGTNTGKDTGKANKASKITKGVDSRGRTYYADENGRRVSTEKGKAATASKSSKALKSAKGILNFFKKIPIPKIGPLAALPDLMINIASAIKQNEDGETDDVQLKKSVVSAIGEFIGAAGGAELGMIIGASAGATLLGPVGGIIGGLGGAYAGYQLGGDKGKEVAERLFDYAQESDMDFVPKFLTAEKIKSVEEIQTDAAGNVISTSSVEPTTTTPAPQTQSNFGKSQRTVAAQKSTAAAASPVAIPSAGEKLNNVISKNNEEKLPKAQSNDTNVINRNTVASSNSSEKYQGPILPVRNPEETFRKLISESIRVV